MSASAERFSKTMRAKQQQFTTVKTEIAIIVTQLAGSVLRITPDEVDWFAAFMKQKLNESDLALRQFYARAIVDRVEVGSKKIRIPGKVSALERAVSASASGLGLEVRPIKREWRTRHDRIGHSQQRVISVALGGK